ncbi:MAG: elongation factor G [Hyphomicrobiales bacterium]
MGDTPQSGQATGRGGPKCIAIVGPYLSGKTSLLEALLFRSGAMGRQGKVGEGNTVGDGSAEARAHGMSVELNVAHTEFIGDEYTFIDCPGSIEFAQDQIAALAVCDAAIVVCEPDEKKVPALQLILKKLDEFNIPRFLFLNKIDKASGRVRDVLQMLQPASSLPLVLRQIPMWENEIATGFVDLALERAYVYREHAESEIITLPDALSDRKEEARFSMLEQLADYDDALMEALLEDIEPPRDQVFDDLQRELVEGQIVPVLLGSAENSNGILRLFKALRHEAPGVEQTAARLGVPADSAGTLQVFKTFHTTHGGKLSLARLMAGEIADGATLYNPAGDNMRPAGLFKLQGQEPTKVTSAVAGETLALGRLEDASTGDTLSVEKGAVAPLAPLELPSPVYGLCVEATDRKDEVKLSTSLNKIIDEDPSLVLEHNQHTNEMVLWGHGEIHLRVTLERLAGKYGIQAQAKPRRIAYSESIRKPVSERGRHKKQSGGHGQFGDVVLDVKPLARGGGFAFDDTITGGVVPKQYFSAVENGVRDFMQKGPLGFPVVDVAVTLTDGSYHTVDSSEQAFKTAGRIAMAEAMPKASPVLLEPIVHIKVHVPSDATARINQIVSQRRGQLLGYDGREGWPGWDTVEAHMPEAEVQDLIIELRSATAGVGTFAYDFDHMSELSGREADLVIQEAASAAA